MELAPFQPPGAAGARLRSVVLDKTSPVDCPAPLPDSLISPSAGQLTTKAAGVPANTDPCIVPANGGYRGSGNRCYKHCII